MVFYANYQKLSELNKLSSKSIKLIIFPALIISPAISLLVAPSIPSNPERGVYPAIKTFR
jgi:hypothetical protein